MSTDNHADLEMQARDNDLRAHARHFMLDSAKHRYSYNFTWLGRPIIQYPQDIVAMQEVVWAQKPDLIVETGIAHGGSLVLYASLLELIGGEGRVLGIDVDIRPHNRSAIEGHPMAQRIDMIQGSSVAPEIVAHVRACCQGKRSVLVVLDSNHTHAHILAELRAYAPLVSPGGYCVVFDTVIEDFPPGWFHERPWDKGNSPMTAVAEFLAETAAGKVRDASGTPVRFAVEQDIDKKLLISVKKLLISVAPGGYLRRLG
jgi:cephalosporin hydroxylase